MSITTKQGDSGETALAGGARVSKADLRVEAYGTVDELNSVLGFARSLCSSDGSNTEIKCWTEEIQRTLFRVGGELAAPAAAAGASGVNGEDIDQLTQRVYALEARPGILSDWSLPGSHTAAAAFDMARVVCRRAERATVRLLESGAPVRGELLAWLNRLSDLLWLFGRVLELEAGVDSHLRDDAQGGSRWSRAW